MESKTKLSLYNKDNIQINLSSDPIEGFFELAESTLWGTGDTQYLMRDIKAVEDMNSNSLYAGLTVDGALAGITIIRQHEVKVFDKYINGVYLSIVSIKAEYRNKGYVKLLEKVISDYFLDLDEATVVYCYVEDDNEYSKKAFTSCGFEELDKFDIVTFSRINPKDNRDVFKLTNNDSRLGEWIDHAKFQYEKDILLDTQIPLHCGKRYALYDKGVLLSGLQFFPMEWTIKNLPGFSGWLALNLLCYIPGVGKIFATEPFRHLKMGNLFSLNGSEEHLLTLMEAVLYREKVNNAIIYFSQKSLLYDKLKEYKKFGLVYNTSLSSALVLAKSNSINLSELKLSKNAVNVSYGNYI